MRSPSSFSVTSFLAIVLIASAVACDDKKEDAAAAPTGPIVGALELPVSLRSSAAAPADAAEVEISPSEIHVAGQPVMTLNAGSVAASDRQGTELPKLSAALKSPMRARIALSVSAQVPYETLALVLSTAKSAGMRGAAFKVRPPGGGTGTGWLALDDYVVQPASKSDEEVALQSVAVRPWSDFVSKWDDVQNACRTARSGSCAFKPEKVAEGGNLKIILHTSGQGANVDFYRVGGPAPEAEKPKTPVKMIEGVKQTDIVKDVEEALPATEASFQFRAQEALTAPSPVSATVAPVCGTSACGVFVTADKTTLLVRVISLLGAAFPDNTPAPIVAFELP